MPGWCPSPVSSSRSTSRSPRACHAVMQENEYVYNVYFCYTVGGLFIPKEMGTVGPGDRVGGGGGGYG